jgi:hypothetical protein
MSEIQYITREELEQLGFADYRPGSQTQLPWPEPEAESASGVVPALTLAACLVAPSTRAATPQSARAGVEVSICRESPRVLKLKATSPSGALSIRPRVEAPETEDSIYFAQEDAGIAVVDTTKVPSFLVTSPGGVLVVYADASGLTCELLEIEVDQVLDVEPFAEVTAPIATWLTHLDDRWLHDQVTARLVAPTSWDYGSVAGMLTRLVEFRDPRAAVQRILAGQPEPLHAEPRKWARALPPPQLRTLQSLALAEVDILHEAIRELRKSVDNDEPEWQGEWSYLCQRRDDLESVRVLLHEAGADARLSEALRRLDREGELLRLALPWTDDLVDERASRIGSRDPGAWWGTFSLGEGELA